MQKIVTFLVVAFLIGGTVYALVTYPAGCKKLGSDSARDAAAVCHGIGSVRENGVNHWDRVVTPLKKLADDAGTDLLYLDDPAAAARAQASLPTDNSAAADAPSDVPSPPAWTAPAVLPAKDNWTWTTVSGETYSNVKVLGMAQDSVTITYDGGGATVLVSDLPPYLQKELGYTPVDLPSSAAVTAAASGAPEPAKPDVMAAYQAALNQARANGSKVLLLFTGSTWCPTCISLEKNVLPSAKFRYFVDSDYVLVKIEIAQQNLDTDANEILDKQYNVQGLPTLIALGPDGKEIGRSLGCPPSFASDQSRDSFIDFLIADLTNRPPPQNAVPF